MRSKAVFQRVGATVKSALHSLSDGSRARRRAENELATKQANYLSAAYDSATGGLQKRFVNTLPRSEYGQLMVDPQRFTIVETSREIFRNSALYSGLLSRWCDSVVGTGLEVVPRTSDQGLNKELQHAFREYTDVRGGWEVTGQFSLGQSQRLTLTSVARDGDLLMFRSDDGWQFFENGQVGTPYGYDSISLNIRQGVQFEGPKPAYYWVGDYSPGLWGYVDMRTARGLRADKCRHVWNPEFFSGVRGLPIFQNDLQKFNDIDNFLEAELMANIASSCYIGEINSPHQNALDALNVARGADRNTTDPHKNFQMAPASVVRTGPNEKFTLHSPARPATGMPDYVRLNVRLLGFRIGMPLELSLMDFTQTNFAGAKMGVTQAALTLLFWRHNIVQEQHVRPVYLDFLATQKVVKIPAKTENVERFETNAPRNAWLDEYKQALALNEGIDGGWDTVTRIAREEMNRTVEDLFEERADEILLAMDIAKKKKLPDYREILKHVADFKEKPSPDSSLLKTGDKAD